MASDEKDYDPHAPDPDDMMRKLLGALTNGLNRLGDVAKARMSLQEELQKMGQQQPILVKIPREATIPMIRVGMISNGYLAMYEDEAGREIHRHFATLGALGMWAEIYFSRFAKEVNESPKAAPAGSGA